MYRLTSTVKGKTYLYYRCHGNERNPSTCRLMIPLDEADQRVETLVWEKWGMEPYKEVTVIPGTNHEDEIDAIKQDFNDNHDPEDEDYLEAAAAMQAEIAELRDKPRKPDEVIEKIVLGLTRADVWMMGPTVADQRRALMRWGLKLYAYRTEPKGFELRAA
jgi:hypothetical protein